MTRKEIRHQLLELHMYQAFDKQDDAARELTEDHADLEDEIMEEYHKMVEADLFSKFEEQTLESIDKLIE